MKCIPLCAAHGYVQSGTARLALDQHLGISGTGMSIFRDAMPEFLGGLAVVLVVAVFGMYVQRRRNKLRRYTLLNSVDPEGNPVLHVTTRRAGIVIRRDVGHGPERFELTDVQLPDNTYAAEPLDRFA
ncbi:hypothetical protein AB0E85_06040 [Streptomyces sp. NPDC029044]|uniref:hypothetical protein n=1 Tax=Streptomyces sp. NPDC029044 TaxID=3157198 RepID=UPI0033FBC2F8